MEFRNVKIVKDRDSKEIILEIEVRGKRGIGWYKSTPRAVEPFRRLLERKRPEIVPESDEEEEAKVAAPIAAFWWRRARRRRRVHRHATGTERTSALALAANGRCEMA